MTQKIIKVGSSVALVIPKHVSKKEGLIAGREVSFSCGEKGELIYTPLKSKSQTDNKQKKVANIIMNFINRYRKDLEALKDK